MPEDAHRHLDEDAERALGALHQVVDLRARRRRGHTDRLEGASRSHVLLTEDELVDVAVIRRRLSGAERDDPAADRRVLERLREVAAGVAPLGPEPLRRVVERRLERGPEHPRLHARGLVGVVDREHLIHVRAQHERDPALHRAQAEVDRRAAAEHRHRDPLGVAIGHDLLHILLVAGMHDEVGDLAHDALPQLEDLLGGLAGRVLHAAEVVGGDVAFTDEHLHRVDVPGLERRRAIQDDG